MADIAIITGASSGLGAEFARQLCREAGIKEIWLIARRGDRLMALARELKHFPVKFRCFSLDLTCESAIDLLEETLKKEKPMVRWLICAAGTGKIGSNSRLGRQEIDQMILLNTKAAVDVTHVVLPYTGKKSHILEICSTAAFQPLAGLGVYAATKAFLLSFSRSLRVESKAVVTAICPYWIKDTSFISVACQTKDSRAIRHFPLASKRKNVVRHALADARLGLAVSTPGLVCTVHRFAAKILPHGLLQLVWEWIRRI